MKRTGSLFFQMISIPSVMQRKDGSPVSFQTMSDYHKKLKYASDYFQKKGVRRIAEIDIKMLQEYADHLELEGKSPSTIHNYLAPLCKVFFVSMQQIRKPRRTTSEYTRSRTKPDRYENTPLDQLPPSVLLSKCTGLRRSELKRVKGRDLLQENGVTYVLAEKGKGGKRQMQRILPKYVPLLENLFRDVTPDEKVLKEFVSKYDYHLVRRKLALECYEYYASICAQGPDSRKALYKEIAAYWHKYNKRYRDKLEPYSFFEKPYFLRGKTKLAALAQDKPLVLDRLCLRAVSIFHLAHWRDSVTTQSYYLD